MVSPEEFDQLMLQHRRGVFRMLNRLVGPRDEIEDLAQEVFMRLYRGLKYFRNEGEISTYLYRIVYNVAQDVWKKRQRLYKWMGPQIDQESIGNNLLADPGCNAEQLIQKQELEMYLREAMLSLSDVQKTIIVFYHQEERSYAEIAAILDLPVGTVKTHLHRARGKLRIILNEREKAWQRMTESAKK